MRKLIFVDCEATGPCPGKGVLTEFGAVDFKTRRTFHGVLYEARPRKDDPAHSERTGREFDAVAVYTDFEGWLDSLGKGQPVFVSDNPAYDWQWINYGFWHTLDAIQLAGAETELAARPSDQPRAHRGLNLRGGNR